MSRPPGPPGKPPTDEDRGPPAEELIRARMKIRQLEDLLRRYGVTTDSKGERPTSPEG